MSSNILIEAIGVSHSFDYPLYRDINLSIAESESISIVGRSGSGKSTLLHTMATFLEPDSGKAMLLGEDIYTKTPEQLEDIRREKLGIIFQTHYLFKGMTARENIAISAELVGREIDEKILQRLEIDGIIEQKIGELSGGQQQRVSIARVLSKQPKVIFADEPTGNLDTETSTLVMSVLLEYIQEHQASLFLVTHDHNIAQRCDRKYTLEALSLIESINT